MFFDLDGLYLPVEVVTHPVTPDKRNHGQQEQFFQPFQIRYVGVFDVEAAGLHSPEQGLDLPAFPVVGQGLIGLVERHQYEQLGLSVCHDLGGRQVAKFPAHFDDVLVMPALAGTQLIEQVGDLYFHLLPGDEDLEVVAYAYVVPDMVFIEESQPLDPDKLPVGKKAIYGIPAEPIHEVTHQGYALDRAGVALFVQHPEHQGDGYISVANAQH